MLVQVAYPVNAPFGNMLFSGSFVFDDLGLYYDEFGNPISYNNWPNSGFNTPLLSASLLLGPYSITLPQATYNYFTLSRFFWGPYFSVPTALLPSGLGLTGLSMYSDAVFRLTYTGVDSSGYPYLRMAECFSSSCLVSMTLLPAQSVPESSTMALAVGAVGGLLWMRRKRQVHGR